MLFEEDVSTFYMESYTPIGYSLVEFYMKAFFENWKALDISKIHSNEVQLRASETAPLVERKDVSFILTIFPQNFWNK